MATLAWSAARSTLPLPRPARSGSCSSRARCETNTARVSERGQQHARPPLTGLVLKLPSSPCGVAGDAYLQLGSLAHSSGEWNEAQHYYEQALRVAETHADRESSDLARCNVGLTQGNMEFESFLSNLTT